MRKKRGEAGLSLVELLIASAIAALIVGLLSAATFQFVTATNRGHDRLAVLRDHGTAFQWLNRDAQMAVPEQAIVLPTSVTLNWTDWTDGPTGKTYESSYAQSGDELVRTLTEDGGAPSSQTVARNLAPSPSGFSASLTDDLLTVSVTSTEGSTTQTRSESILMRAAPTPTPTPTPIPVNVVTVTGTTGTGASTTANFSGGTALNKMFHFCSFSYNANDNLHDQTYRSTALTAVNTLTIYAGQTSGNRPLTYHCSIIIFPTDADLVVNRYSRTGINGLTTISTTITAVSSRAQAFVIPHGETNPSDTDVGREELYDYQLTSTTNVNIMLDNAEDEAGATFRFEVVDWNNSGIRVQHLNGNTMTTTETTDTATIPTPITSGKAWLIVTGRTSGGLAAQSTGSMNIRADFSDNSTVRVRRGITSSTAFVWSAQVIEDVSASGIWDVQMGNISMTTAQTSNTLTLSPSVNTSRTFAAGTAFPHFAFSGQSPDATTSNQDTVAATVALTNSTTITATRGVTDSRTLDIIVQAVQFR